MPSCVSRFIENWTISWAPSKTPQRIKFRSSSHTQQAGRWLPGPCPYWRVGACLAPFALIFCNNLTILARYRDCNIKIRVAFELDKTNGAVMFVKLPSRSSDDVAKLNSKRSCFGLTRNVTKSLALANEKKNPNQLQFVCELQLILKVAALKLVVLLPVVTFSAAGT